MRMLAAIIYLIFLTIVWGALRQVFPGVEGLILLIVTFLLSFVATFFHELGHALAALKLGGRVRTFCVMPFAIRMNPVRVEFAHRQKLGGDVGGYVNATFEWDLSRREHVIVAAAGPAANVALTLICLVLALAIDLPGQEISLIVDGRSTNNPGLLPPDAALEGALRDHLRAQYWSLASGLLRALAALSAGMAAVNLVPFKRSDGEAILKALRRRNA